MTWLSRGGGGVEEVVGPASGVLEMGGGAGRGLLQVLTSRRRTVATGRSRCGGTWL